MGEDEFEFEGFEGIDETPLPDMFGDDMSADTDAFGQEVPQRRRPVEGQQQPRRPSPDYDAASASGAQQGRTQRVRQGYSQPGQSIDGDFEQGQPAPAPKPTQPRRQAQPQQSRQGQPQQRRPAQQQRPQQAQGGQQRRPQQPVQQNKQPPNNGGGGKGGKPKKGLPIIPIILVVVILVVGAIVTMKFLKPAEEVLEPAEQGSYETSGRFALDTMLNALQSYDPTVLDNIVGTTDGDSYLAQEWAYVNKVKIREEFIHAIGATVRFDYPMVQQYSTTGVPMYDEMGNPIMIKSMMNANEEFTVTIPDYAALAQTMDEKSDYILRLLESSHFEPTDYTWPDELMNLMLQFVLDDGEIPTTQVQVQIPIRLGLGGQPYLESDAILDDLLFGSADFRAMCAKFSQVCVGWTGYVEEEYLDYERRHNDEYDRWLELFLTYFLADGGVYDPDGDPQFTNSQRAFNSRTSKWEPWYLRDENNVIQKYEDGSYIVNYFTVKDENGNDWIQPAVEIEVEVPKTRLLDDPWVEETGIFYNCFGMHWIQTEYKGKGTTVTRVGDGSRDHPAGIGTTIITKVIGTDGEYHDVKVALLGYWTGQSAIDYAEKFSTRNRGFTASSVIQLICYEVYVENLEAEPFSFESSEMTLTDKNGNISSRTGTMYEFTGVVTLAGRDDKYGLHKVILNDWATSTELNQKYVCWGKSFGRLFPIVYFDCLAGTGDIPSYSAYEQFTGKSSLNENVS